MEWGDGMHDKGDAEKYLHPFALARLQHNLNGGNVWNHDISNMGLGDDANYDDTSWWAEIRKELQYVQHMTMQYFRRKELFLTSTFYGDWCGLLKH